MSILLSHLHCLDNQFLYTYKGAIYAESRGIVSCAKLNLSLRCNINYFGDYHFKQVIEAARRVDTLTSPVIDRLNGKITKFNGKRGASLHLTALTYQPSANVIQLQMEVQALRRANARKDICNKPPITMRSPNAPGAPTVPFTAEQLAQTISYTIAVGEKLGLDETTKTLTVSPEAKKTLQKSDYFKALFSTSCQHFTSFEEISSLVDNMLLYINLQNKDRKEELLEWKGNLDLSTALGIDKAINNLLFALAADEPNLSCFWEELLCDALPLSLQTLDLIPQLSDYLTTYNLRELTKKIANFLIDTIGSDALGDFLKSATFVLPLHTLEPEMANSIHSCFNERTKDSLSNLFSKITAHTLMQSNHYPKGWVELLARAGCEPLCKQIAQIEFSGFTKETLKPFLTQEILNYFPNLICLDLGNKVEATGLENELKKQGFSPSSFGTRFIKLSTP